MKSLLSFLFLSFAFSLFSQTPDAPPTSAYPPQEGDTAVTVITGGTPEPDTTVYRFAETMAQFPGGEEAFKKYLTDSLRHPKTERLAPEVAKFYVHFIVEKDGSITYVFVAKGEHGYPELYAEAIRVIAAMPKWSPGIINGKPVRVEFFVPVRFITE